MGPASRVVHLTANLARRTDGRGSNISFSWSSRQLSLLTHKTVNVSKLCVFVATSELVGHESERANPLDNDNEFPIGIDRQTAVSPALYGSTRPMESLCWLIARSSPMMSPIGFQFGAKVHHLQHSASQKLESASHSKAAACRQLTS